MVPIILQGSKLWVGLRGPMECKMETYALNKNEYIEYSPDFINKVTIRKLLKLDVSKVSLKESELVAKQLKKMTKKKMLAVVKQKAPLIDYEAIDLDGVSFKRGEDIESIVKKVFKYAESDKYIGRKAIKAKFSDGTAQTYSSPKRRKKVTKLASSMVNSQVNDHMESAYNTVLVMVNETCSKNPVEEYVDHANQNSVNITRSVSEGKVWHKIDGQPFLVYSAKLQSKSVGNILSIVMKWVAVVFDILSIIASLIGILVPKLTKAVLGQMGKLLTGAWNKLKSIFSKFGQAIKTASDSFKGKDQIIAMFKGLCEVVKNMMKQGPLMWKAVKIFLVNLRWWEVLICVVSFIATLVILIASQGTAVIAKVIILAAQFVILATDVTTAVIATV